MMEIKGKVDLLEETSIAGSGNIIIEGPPGPPGPPGEDYILTEADKQEIAGITEERIQPILDEKADKTELDDYVKNTDYATGSKVGVFKIGHGLTLGSEHQALAQILPKATYDAVDGNFFIGKGTLNNVLGDYAKKESLTFTRINASTLKNATKLYDVINGEWFEIPANGGSRAMDGFIEYSQDKSIINMSIKALRFNGYEYGMDVATSTQKVIDFGEIIPGFRPKQSIRCYSFAKTASYQQNANASGVPLFGGDNDLIYNTDGHLYLYFYTWALPTETKPYLQNAFQIWQLIFNA